MKSYFYGAIVTKTYREAVNSYMEDPENYVLKDEWLSDLESVSHRIYSKGFYLGKPVDGQIYTTSSYIKTHDFSAITLGYEEGRVYLEQRNKIFDGDTLDLIGKDGFYRQITVTGLKDEEGKPIESTPHPEMKYSFLSEEEIPPFTLVRKKR